MFDRFSAKFRLSTKQIDSEDLVYARSFFSRQIN